MLIISGKTIITQLHYGIMSLFVDVDGYANSKIEQLKVHTCTDKPRGR